jgi:5-methylcytosine-specific restriction endonuclease McrA
MSQIYNILRDLKKDKIIEHYTDKERYIGSGLYNYLKSRKRCMCCKKKFLGSIPEIHHIIPVCKGGSNNSDNLLALCSKCHELKDKEVLGC